MKQGLIDEVRAFNRFYTDIIGLLNRNFLDSPYSLAEIRVVYEIFHHKGIRASQIMEIMHIDKSYLSRILKKLEKDGLLLRERSEEDARAFLLSLTEKGNTEFQWLNKASNEQVTTLLAPLTEKKKETLVRHMQNIIRILTPENNRNENN
ncbi:MarR family winged helix-turn-helix transcriptional regulator [Sinomicrobium weinanense]|uniref:Winged helix-turn-helix transcriptional regulator n=1 Tax=Sinomicrobium weinanense TaxID=2842200 RepID=A0A926JQP2_9FLAO|nr:MarR family winged helix-turn-helix transcriptional regulator [Sinomicrobium weinanense]MBC9795537.1 winged helix-turn-helix transcriptional regulator [Sinomicrobium weinanense]MBU3123316.1 MarR family winged helix-turn-helix transcriptional regulator [Sinomicrobium weinanense]